MTFKQIKYLLIIYFLLSGCEKKPFDYRNKYCGIYEFTYTEAPWTFNNGPSPVIEGKYTGRIFYDKKDEADLIKIKFKENMTLNFTLGRKGNLVGCGGGGLFEKRNSVSFVHGTSRCPGGGHGGGYNYTVTGTKK